MSDEIIHKAHLTEHLHKSKCPVNTNCIAVTAVHFNFVTSAYQNIEVVFSITNWKSESSDLAFLILYICPYIGTFFYI